MNEASTLALVLRTGALPAPVSVTSVRVVGASLGQDAIEAGETATAVGFGLVLAFMVGIRLDSFLVVISALFYVCYLAVRYVVVSLYVKTSETDRLKVLLAPPKGMVAAVLCLTAVVALPHFIPLLQVVVGVMLISQVVAWAAQVIR